jgi:hypothetical protein
MLPTAILLELSAQPNRSTKVVRGRLDKVAEQRPFRAG